jgi:hypothetical protein
VTQTSALPDVQEKAETLLKAFLQQYNNPMIENRLTAENDETVD